jgi:hypothetical protein
VNAHITPNHLSAEARWLPRRGRVGRALAQEQVWSDPRREVLEMAKDLQQTDPDDALIELIALRATLLALLDDAQPNHTAEYVYFMLRRILVNTRIRQCTECGHSAHPAGWCMVIVREVCPDCGAPTQRCRCEVSAE